MKLKSLINISENYFRNKNRFRFQVFIIFSLMFFLLFFIITFSSTFHGTIKRVFSTDENTFITIVPKDMDIGIFKFNTPKMLGKGSLTEKDSEYFSTIEGVSAISPTYTLDAPANLSGKLFDMGYGTDLSVFGEERPFSGKWYSKKNTNEIRAIASSKLLDIYNSSFAPANDLPKMTEKILIGRKFDLTVGSNSIKDTGNSHKMKVTIIGLDKDVPFLGLTVPETTLKRVAEIINVPVQISSIKVYFKTPSDLLESTTEIESKGYSIAENENDLFRTINRYISKIDYFLFLPVVFIILIISLFVQNQIRYMLLYLKREIGVQMALGVYDRDIIFIWLYQYAKYIIYGLITGSGVSFVIVRSLMSLMEGSFLTKVIIPDYNIISFVPLSLSMISFALIYVMYKLKDFLNNNSIVDLMSNE